ncbi:hypothetical protein ABZV60_25350 [Streptomyces sp. NPDC004787]|uniref:hypothetical protein n=1 Tax=Streptomyces sp. NPDC004787 TaxID=3154291 RepID=UPI0033AD7202
MSHPTPGHHPRHEYHLPDTVPRPEGLPADIAQLLHTTVRNALQDAIRAAETHRSATPPGTAAHGGSRHGHQPDEKTPHGDTYRVPSYDDNGRPAAVPLVRTPAPAAAGRPAGGIGPGASSAPGRRDLGTGPRPAPGPAASPAAAAATREHTWTPQALEALRTRMGHGFRNAPTGRISADTLVLGEQRIRLVPGLGGTDKDRTVAARLGEGAYYLDPIPRERFGLQAAAVPGAGYAVHQVGDDGRRHDTGLRVLTWNTAAVPAGILAYTTDINTLRETTIVGRKPGDPRTAAARIAAALDKGLSQAPGSVVATTLKAHLRDLDDEELMAAFEELRKLGKLGETLALVRVREFRAYLHERKVPWSYVFANWEPNVADGAAVFSGVLWGAGESVTDVLEVIGMLAGSLFSERLAQERHRFWTAIVACIQHPVVTGQAGLQQLRDTFWEKLEQLEFFDAGRFLGQLVVALLTLPEAIRALPKLARSAARVVATINRIGIAVIDRIGLTLRDVVRFLTAERHALVTDNGVVLMMNGDDILASGTKAKGTSALAHSAVVKALQDGTALLPEADIDEAMKRLTDIEKKMAPKAGEAAAGGAEGSKAVLTVEALEDLVGRAIAELGEAPGSPTLTNSVRGTRLHSIFARLVREKFPNSGLTLVPETSLRSFAKLPADVLDLPIETYVKRTPGLMPYERELRPLFTGEGGKPRLIGDLRPDLVVRAPGELVIFDLTSVEKARHMAKDILYTLLLRESGEVARVGETYWRHFGKTSAEIAALYPRDVRAAARQAELARHLKSLHDAQKAAQ